MKQTITQEKDTEHCPFCKAKYTKYWHTVASKSDEKRYPIRKCQTCEGAFVFPIPDEEQLSFFYKSSNNSMERNLGTDNLLEQYEKVIQEEIDYPNATIDATRIADKIKQRCKHGRLLDIGSGYGFFSHALIKAGFEVDALELNEAMRKIYKRMNGFEPVNQSFNNDFADDHQEKYDAVLLSQVLEHLPMNANPIKNIHKLLKNNGICVIAVPHFQSYISKIQGKKDMFITPPEHINFFTIKSLTQAFAAEGFETLHIETVSRYDYNKLTRKFGFISAIPKLIMKIFFKLSDYNKRGMFINAYFIKNNAATSLLTF